MVTVKVVVLSKVIATLIGMISFFFLVAFFGIL